MKKNLVAAFIIFLLVLIPGCKKRYSCSCLVDYKYEIWSSGEPATTYQSYKSVESINQRTTKKQASDICDKTQSSIYASLVNTWNVQSYPRPQDVHVSCRVK